MAETRLEHLNAAKEWLEARRLTFPLFLGMLTDLCYVLVCVCVYELKSENEMLSWNFMIREGKD